MFDANGRFYPSPDSQPTINPRLYWVPIILFLSMVALLLVLGACSLALHNATRITEPPTPTPTVEPEGKTAEELGRDAGKAYEKSKKTGKDFVEGFKEGAGQK